MGCRTIEKVFEGISRTDKIERMIKLYLDIDGVLLHTKKPCAAEYAAEFIDYVTANFDCYWLTTHCKGDATTAQQYLSEYFPAEVMEKISRVKPTNWDALKTDAINFDEKFYWLDDYPFRAELDVLKQHNQEKRCIVVDLNNYNELKNVVIKLGWELFCLADHWNCWKRGVGFDIASTAYLNEDEKTHLIKSMEAIADSYGALKWTDKELELLKRIKDYNYHIGYLFRE